ncbi:phage tail protein [Shinella sp. HZN7]|uniref:phage tail protein n=1 Tax=Shinella sp. (strain HZN7) TaxID=879274 RepID=UPI0007DA5A22|nr:phage tail protein [Shinella sp. HZN7]ANH04983.1 hypothetical protein shn_13660 [Shinella sp. HZN7]
MIYLLGDIPLGVAPVTGPISHDFSFTNTFVQHAVTRGKPVVQDVGSELDVRNFEFFLSEEFCDVEQEFAKLQMAFLTKTPNSLSLGSGGYDGKRWLVEALSGRIAKTSSRGVPVRIEATISLLEDPVAGGLYALINSIAKSRAAATSATAGDNPEVRR